MGKNKQPRFIPAISDFSASMQKKVSTFSDKKLGHFAISCIHNNYKPNSIHMACCAELVRRKNNV